MQDKKCKFHGKSSSFHGNFFNASKTQHKAIESSTSPSISSRTSSNKSPAPTRVISKSQSKASNINLIGDTPLICNNCFKFMQQEAKMIEEISKIVMFLNSVTVSIQEWKKGKIELPEKFSIAKEGANALEFDCGKKLAELCKSVDEITQVICALGKDICVLSKTTNWECVQVKNEERVENEGVLAIIGKAKECVFRIRSEMIEKNNPKMMANEIIQALSLQLAHCKREKFKLETEKIKLNR